MCNHDINSNDCSIIIEDKKFFGVLQIPKKYIGICKECKKQFKYIKDNKNYKEVE